MRLSALRELCERDPANGPVATVYLDRDAADESAARRTDLRWRALGDDLAEHGADRAAVEALADAVREHLERAEPTGGRMFVAESGKVRVDLPLRTPGTGDVASWAVLPHLTTYARTQEEPLPHAVVTVDRVCADIAVYADPAEEPAASTTVEGEPHPVHKAGAGGWAHYRMQKRVETQWEHNAAVAADAVTATVRGHGLDLVVLAGDVRARGLLLDQLPEAVRAVVVPVEPGGRAGGTDDESLLTEVRVLVDRHRAYRLEQLADRFRRELDGDRRSVRGSADTLEALRMGGVQTLLLDVRASGGQLDDRESVVGPGPADVAAEPGDLPGIGPDRLRRAPLGDALVRAAVGTSAEVTAVPPGLLDLDDGVGAILRFPKSIA